MSMNFRTVYVTAIVLTLLFGVGLGYQIHALVGDERDDSAEQDTTTDSQGLFPSVTSTKPVTEVFLRTGEISSISGDRIDFSSYVQNTDASFTKTTLTAVVDDATTFSKIIIDGSTVTEEAIALEDLHAGDDIAVQSATNVYGKTLFNASHVQLHAY